MYCQLQQDQQATTLLIQASAAMAPLPLHAEALDLLLAAQTTDFLLARQVTFLTDNLSLAKAAVVIKTTDLQVPWEIKQQIAQNKHVSQRLQLKIYHVKRDLNGVAHNCTHRVPIFSCSNSAHVPGTCPIALALQNLNLRGIVLHGVNCL